MDETVHRRVPVTGATIKKPRLIAGAVLTTERMLVSGARGGNLLRIRADTPAG